MVQKKKTRRSKKKPEETEAPPASSQGSDLLAQAQAWGDVVRESLARSERGEEAERELSRRRNNSGQ